MRIVRFVVAKNSENDVGDFSCDMTDGIHIGFAFHAFFSKKAFNAGSCFTASVELAIVLCADKAIRA